MIWGVQKKLKKYSKSDSNRFKWNPDFSLLLCTSFHREIYFQMRCRLLEISSEQAAYKIYSPEKDSIKTSKLFPLFRTNTQLVNAQTTYANLLQFEIESKRLGTCMTKFQSLDAIQQISSSSRLMTSRRKKVRNCINRLSLGQCVQRTKVLIFG